MTLALYEIAQEYRQMVAALTNTQDDAQAIADTIEAEGWSLQVKAQNVAYAPKMLKPLNVLDSVLCKVPGVRSLSWVFTFELLKAPQR